MYSFAVAMVAHSMTHAPVLVAPDSFKGTFRATAVAAAIGRGLEAAGLPRPTCARSPTAARGRWRRCSPRSAARPRRRGSTTRSAASCTPASRCSRTAARRSSRWPRPAGWRCSADDERDAEAASTYGTGELVTAAVAAGAEVVLVACGGSATTDGAAGAIEAIEEAGGLSGARLVMLCDVRTPFERRRRSSGPQKGADPATVRRLTRAPGAARRRRSRATRAACR